MEIKYLKDKNKLVRIITNSRIEKYISIPCPRRSSEGNVVKGIYFLYKPNKGYLGETKFEKILSFFHFYRSL